MGGGEGRGGEEIGGREGMGGGEGDNCVAIVIASYFL